MSAYDITDQINRGAHDLEELTVSYTDKVVNDPVTGYIGQVHVPPVLTIAYGKTNFTRVLNKNKSTVA